MRTVRMLAPLVAALGLLSMTATALASPTAVAAKHKAKKGKTETIKGGTITFTLLASVASSFARDKDPIALAPVLPATGSGSTVIMPISHGKLNSVTGAGSVVAGGGAPGDNGFTLTQTIPPSFGGLLPGGTLTFSLNAPLTLTFGGTAKFGPGTGSNLIATVNGGAGGGPFFTLKQAKPKLSAHKLTLGNIPAALTSPAAQVLGSFAGVKFKTGEKLATITIHGKT